MSEKSRIEYIDIAKGIGIFAVMLGHILVYESGVVFNRIQNFICSFHLPLFFIITGILCEKYRSWQNKSLSELLKRKLKTLIYPYFIFSVITVLFYVFLYFILHKGTYQEISDIIMMTITFRGYGALWYLFVLFVAIMMFYIFQKLKWNSYIVLLLLIFGGSFLSYQFPMLLDEFSIGNKLISYYFTRWIIACSYIYIGYLSANILQWDIWKNKMICVATGLLMLILTFILCQFNGKVDLCVVCMNNPVLYYLFAVMGTFSVVLLCKGLEKVLNLLIFAGKNSLIIMATHGDFITYVLVVVRKILIRFSVSGVWEVGITFLLLLFVEIMIVLVINRWLPFIVRFPDFHRKQTKI